MSRNCHKDFNREWLTWPACILCMDALNCGISLSIRAKACWMSCSKSSGSRQWGRIFSTMDATTVDRYWRVSWDQGLALPDMAQMVTWASGWKCKVLLSRYFREAFAPLSRIFVWISDFSWSSTWKPVWHICKKQTDWVFDQLCSCGIRCPMGFCESVVGKEGVRRLQPWHCWTLQVNGL